MCPAFISPPLGVHLALSLQIVMELSSFTSKETPRDAPSTRVSGPWRNFWPFAETLTPCCFSCSLRKISSHGFLKISGRKSAPTLLKAPRHQILGKSNSPSFPSPARKAEGVFGDKATAPENPTFLLRKLVSRGFTNSFLTGSSCSCVSPHG